MRCIIYYIDSETSGLHGIAVIIQYALDDGPIIIHEIWTTPIKDTLDLIETFCNSELCFFNAVFDWFHLNKIYNTLDLFPDHDAIPIEHIDELAALELQARDHKCLKPKAVIDIMLHARKGPFQNLMDRSDVRIKKVPSALVVQLANELEKRIPIPDIFFAKRSNKYQPHFQIEDIEDETEFRDIVLRFRASSSLKALAVHALGIKEATLYDDISLNEHSQEEGWAPFALCSEKPGQWRKTWPALIRQHVYHWASGTYARKYAEDDVRYTRDLYKYFGSPEVNDDDSVLACAVASSRLRGFAVDVWRLKELRRETIKIANSAPKAPNEVKKYVLNLLNDTERIGLQDDSTGKKILEAIAEFEIEENGAKIPHPAALKAREVINARTAQKEIELYDKLIQADRFHADFNIIGTVSSRMSGSGGLNSQGIKSTKKVRSCFPLHFDGDILSIGDFDSFEVSLADAAYNDPRLREDLLNGKSIHAVFGSFVYAPMTYEQILSSKGTINDKYKVSKNCLFSMLYGGTTYTMETKYHVSKENAEKGYNLFLQKYPIVARERKKIQDRFCSMMQENLHGKVTWNEPVEYIESLFGFRRYYTLENQICKALYNLAEKPPSEWLKLKLPKIIRRDREQTVSGAVRSALFAAAFAIQGSNQRSAGNHVIQSSGATITKKLQCKLWELQPNGIYDWNIQLLNIHDELAACHKPHLEIKVKETVDNFIQEMKSKVPLLSMNWKSNVRNWSDK